MTDLHDGDNFDALDAWTGHNSESPAQNYKVVMAVVYIASVVMLQ